MKKVLMVVLVLILQGCGVWLAEWNGDIKKTELKAKGEAELLEAESSKKIAVESAKAQLESAKLLAQAEVERAKGAAEANKIIGESLKNNDSYLKYLYITNLEKGGAANTIYVPTEAGLPLFLEGKK